MPIGTLSMMGGQPGTSKQATGASTSGTIQRKKTAKKNQRIQQLLESMTPSRGSSAKVSGMMGMGMGMGGAGPGTGATATTTAVRQPGFESYAFLAGSSPAPALAQQQFQGQTTSQRTMDMVGAGNPLLAAMDDSEDPTSGGLGTFSPPPAPLSSGTERIQMRQMMAGSQDASETERAYRSMDEDDDEDDMAISSGTASTQPSVRRPTTATMSAAPTLEDYTNLDASPYMDTQRVHYPTNPNNTARIPYSIPAFIDGSKPMYNQALPYSTVSHMGAPMPAPRDELLEKLNKVVHLLEEQKHEKTGHVTEELILYCFLGVFVIFIIDSFVRVGKYVRT
jgi:hypothetical protein